MATLRGLDGHMVLGGMLQGVPLVDAAVPNGGTTMSLYADSLTGVAAPGDVFIIAGNSYTVTSAFQRTDTNRLTDLMFTPGAIGGFPVDTPLLYAMNTIIQTRDWGMAPELLILDTTAQQQSWRTCRSGLAKWTGNFDALLDLTDPAQRALFDHVAGPTPEDASVSLFFGLQADPPEGFYGAACVYTATVQGPLRDLVTLYMAFESDGLAGIASTLPAPCTPVPGDLQDDLAICLDLGELSGTRVDSVGTTDMTSRNDVTWRPGLAGRAAHFDASLWQCLSALSADTTFGNGSTFTWSFWVRPAPFPVGNQALLSQGRNTAAGQYEWFIELLPTGHLWLIFGAAGAGVIASSTNALVAQSWNHVMVWHDLTTLYCQVNQGTIDSNAGSVWIVEGGIPFQIGAIGQDNAADHAANHDFFSGDMQSVQLWRDRVLTLEERATVWNAGAGVRCVCA